VRRFLEFVDVLIDRFKDLGLSVIMTHHFKKPAHDWQGNEVDPLSTYNFRGGSRWGDDVDALICMRRHDDDEQHWRLECEPTLRHGGSMENFWLDVRPESTPPVTEWHRPERRRLNPPRV
jgi:hypothetical protein